ncbi:hypothetical protein FACS189462_0440 [Spirochaetia bacterium]|nr:hypothetical protein FACS189462_0440 [Spirochaetia bacterium]
MSKNYNKLHYFYDVYIYPIFHNTILFNIIPTLFINLLIIILSIIFNKIFTGKMNDEIILLPFIMDLFINPVFLIIGNFVNAINLQRKNYILNILFMMFGTAFGIVLYYINKKILTGSFISYWAEGITIVPVTFFWLLGVFIIGIIEQIILLFLLLKE